MTAAIASGAGTATLRSALDRALDRLALPLSEDQRQSLLRYVALLMQWNGTYNLTAIREPSAMLTHHVIDSLAVVGPLRRETATASGRRLLDVGSGAGLPGVVIAIAAPEFAVACIDSVGKKAAFVRQAAGALKLGNLTALHGRVEELRVQGFDVVASRAFASLETFVASTRHLVSADGCWMAMKGRLPDDELSTLDAKSIRFHVEQIDVPEVDANRCITWIKLLNESERTLSASSGVRA